MFGALPPQAFHSVSELQACDFMFGAIASSPRLMLNALTCKTTRRPPFKFVYLTLLLPLPVAGQCVQPEPEFKLLSSHVFKLILVVVFASALAYRYSGFNLKS